MKNKSIKLKKETKETRDFSVSKPSGKPVAPKQSQTPVAPEKSPVSASKSPVSASKA